MGENGRRQVCRGVARWAPLSRLFLLGALLLLAGCGSWQRFVPAGAPDSEEGVRFSCLEDSVSILISGLNNDPYESDISEQFYCHLEIRSLASVTVVVQVPQLDFVVGEISYPLSHVAWDDDTLERLTDPLSEARLTLPQDISVYGGRPLDPRTGRIQCCADGVKHEGATSALLTGRLLITASDGRRAEIPVRIPLVKTNQRRQFRWLV